MKAKTILFGLSTLLWVGLNGCSTGSSDSTPAVWHGTKELGVPGQDTLGYGVATDAFGNVHVTGYTYGGLDGNMLTGLTDFFVTKYDSTGAKQWTKQLGAATGNTHGYGVAT